MRVHVFREGTGAMAIGSVHGEVQCIMSTDHLGPLQTALTDRQTLLKTLSSYNFGGGW